VPPARTLLLLVFLTVANECQRHAATHHVGAKVTAIGLADCNGASVAIGIFRFASYSMATNQTVEIRRRGFAG